MKIRTRLSAAVDRAISTLLRYDLSRTDVVKWVYFARQMLLIVLISVVTLAGLSAFVSTMQTARLLRDSLSAQARAVAVAAARGAFVPLTLEDEASLFALAKSYRTIDHLDGLKIRDTENRVWCDLRVGATPSARVLRVTAPILPLEAPPGAKPLGFVEVGLRTDWMESKAASIAATNIAITGALALLIFGVGTLVIRNLVDRTRELIGEARLAAEIKRVNAELEAFSYTVAHDLRAPLRAIDGFSLALLDKYNEKLDDEGRDYLRRLRGGSKHMAQLIDDLLNLSRVTRSPMRWEKADLSALAREIAARLQTEQPSRAVDFLIADGLSATGDPMLLRAALENLFGNAWKYTSRHPRARIEFSKTVHEGTEAFFVRDDGAGFDDAYVNKLFKPFSRLHTMSQFEGTGIGLATVQRIIARHGGRIWAESKVEQGAVFYFTLKE